MSVETRETVDAIGVEDATGNVVLTISDHLDWRDERAHLELLQDKINTYLAFVESGELEQVYENAKGRKVVIDVVAKYPPAPAAIEFFSAAKNIAGEAGIILRSRILRISN